MHINPSDVNSLKKFFDDNPYLTNNELAILAGKSGGTIRNWKRKCGLKLQPKPVFGNKMLKNKKREVEKVDDPNIWDNEEWFRQKYEVEGYGIPLITRMIGHSSSVVVNRLAKYDIATRGLQDAMKSKNPCCTEEWMYTHYATRQQYIEWCDQNTRVPEADGGKAWPLNKCAKAAGVVPYTIYGWATRFRIPSRDVGEAVTGEKNPFYGKKHNKEVRKLFREAGKKGAQKAAQIRAAQFGTEGMDPGCSQTPPTSSSNS